ncbi:seminase-like [Eurosta solidaginis]|uniref:seminase-like n=1 Tax=Eurosta solidaginis TaxID=178769 RepID=UPI0035314D44
MQFNFLALLLVVSSSLFAGSNAEYRIVGGTLSNITSSPYMVALHYNGAYFCGGALVSPTHIITAAHCVYGRVPSQISLAMGITNLKEQGQRRTPEKIWVPSVYTQKTMNMDIAVIKVRTPFELDDKVQTIPLCTTTLAVDMPVRLNGWGKINEESTTASSELRTVTVPLVPRFGCLRSYLNAGVALTSSMICAGRGEQDACSGDSGGPGVINNQICGVVSFGVGCARALYPGVYTNINNARVRAFLNECLSR